MRTVPGSTGSNGAALSLQVKLGNLELYVEQESVPSTWYFLIALPILLAIVIVGKWPVPFCLLIPPGLLSWEGRPSALCFH